MMVAGDAGSMQVSIAAGPAAVQWIASTLTGSIASAIAALAVAAIGLSMLAGHISGRRAIWIVIGCFVLFAAAPTANMLVTGTNPGETHAAEIAIERPVPPARPAAPPPAPYDPYAGAAVPGAGDSGHDLFQSQQ